MSQNENRPDFYAGINKIVNYFARTSKGGFLFCSCDSTSMTRLITETVIKQAAEKNLEIKELYLTSDDTHIFLDKVRTAANSKPKGVIISNLDELIVLTKDEIIKDINLSRDILLGIGLPFLFCVSRENISKFANLASDLFIRRDRGTIDFPDIPGYTKTGSPGEFYPLESRNTVDFNSLKLKIDLLEKQFKEAVEKKDRPDRIANDIILDLIDAYLDGSLIKEANELFKKYKTYFNLKVHVKTIDIVARLHRIDSQWDKSLEYYFKLESIYKEVGNAYELSLVLNNIGTVYFEKGEPDKAYEYFLKSKDLFEREGNRAGIGRSLNNIGMIYIKKDELDKALQNFLEAKKIQEATGNTIGLGTVFNNIGSIYSRKGQWNKAYDYYLESKKIFERDGDYIDLELVLKNIEDVKKHITGA
jgi:tetratricopeptide (TPR) repeat protein